MKQPPCLDRIFVAKNKSMHIKTLIALVSSLPLTIAVNFMKYIFQDWEFAKWIGIAIALDTIVSLVKHFFTKDISSETFWAKFAKKIFVYLILLIASNYLTNYTVNGHIIGPTLWIGEYIDELPVCERVDRLSLILFLFDPCGQFLRGHLVFVELGFRFHVG